MTRIISVILTVIFGVLLVSIAVNAAVTVSGTTITLENGETITNGTDGTIQLAGIASTTSITLLNGETITNGTDGTIQLAGIASSTSITLLNGETITNATDGIVTLTATSLKFVGQASTSAIRVGDEADAPVVNGITFGVCYIANVIITASSTGMATCSGATGVVASDRVFVQATSSIPNNFVLQAASSTTAAEIQIDILNIATTTADSGTDDTGARGINFWAFRD